MGKTVRNLDYLRAKDPRLYEAVADLIQQHQNLGLQVNGNSTGEPLPPPAIDGMTVTGQNGQFHIQIQHRAEIYRGVQYYAEFANDPGFQNPHVIHMGDSREHTQFLGNGTYYWRGYAAYASSRPSAPAYHGGAVNPQPVSGGGSVGGPALLPPQGSGTGRAGEGLSGPGPVAFRSSTGIPPKRGESSSIPGGGASGGGGLAPSPATGLPEGMTSLEPSGGGGGGSVVSEPLIAQSEWLTGVAGTNAITGSTAIPYQSLSAGFTVRLVPVNSNTGAVSLSVNGITAAAVTKNGSAALVGGELQANRAYLLLWDGTRWQIIGASLPISATVLASDASGNPAAAALADTKIWIGSGASLPVAQSVSGDATLADTGALTLATVNANVGAFGDSTHVAQVTVNAKGLVTAATAVAIVTAGFSGTVVLKGPVSDGSLTVVNGLITAAVNPT